MATSEAISAEYKEVFIPLWSCSRLCEFMWTFATFCPPQFIFNQRSRHSVALLQRIIGSKSASAHLLIFACSAWRKPHRAAEGLTPRRTHTWGCNDGAVQLSHFSVQFGARCQVGQRIYSASTFPRELQWCRDSSSLLMAQRWFELVHNGIKSGHDWTGPLKAFPA